MANTVAYPDVALAKLSDLTQVKSQQRYSILREENQFLITQ